MNEARHFELEPYGSMKSRDYTSTSPVILQNPKKRWMGSFAYYSICLWLKTIGPRVLSLINQWIINFTPLAMVILNRLFGFKKAPSMSFDVPIVATKKKTYLTGFCGGLKHIEKHSTPKCHEGGPSIFWVKSVLPQECSDNLLPWPISLQTDRFFPTQNNDVVFYILETEQSDEIPVQSP